MTLAAGTDLVPLEEALARYDPVIGLEVHVELGTATKMFCGCATTFGAPPNSQVCPVCLGLPGSLPVINERAVESAVRIGLSLHCTIAPWCRFARKNYFYPDMPKNFQVSQYDEPIAYDGWFDVVVDAPDGPRTVRVEIERAHMEEDTGKSTHMGGATGRIHGADYSLVDYNRAGIPLVEIVTRPIVVEPALAPATARAYVAQLRDLLVALDVSEARMEQGQLRCDANVSVKPRGSVSFGTRTETKNVNSLRSVERAVSHEIRRQAGVLDAGGRVVQQTRHWHEDTQTTTPGRSKEQAEDYRYFPEPDLVPVAPAPEWVDGLRERVPAAPSTRRRDLQEAWGLTDLEMRDVVNAGALDAVEATVALGASPAGAKKWWLGEVARRANELGRGLTEVGVSAADVARVEALVAAGSLNDKLARQVLEGVLAGEGRPDAVIAARGLVLVSDQGALAKAVDDAIAAMPDVSAKVRAGRVAAVGALVGAVMKATKGQADAAAVRALLLERLSP